MNSLKPPHGMFESVSSQTLPWTLGLLGLGGLLLLALILFLGFLSYQDKKRAKTYVPKNPWDELAQVIHARQEQSLKERMANLSFVLRKALELRTREPFTAWTSRELLARLASSEGFSSDFQAQCAEFLKSAELVLFSESGTLDAERKEQMEYQIASWYERLKLGQAL